MLCNIDNTGTKIYQKWWKRIDVIALFQLHNDGNWLFSVLQALYLSFVSKKLSRVTSEGGKFQCFSSCNVSDNSKGTYAIFQPSTEASRGSPVIGIS